MRECYKNVKYVWCGAGMVVDAVCDTQLWRGGVISQSIVPLSPAGGAVLSLTAGV